MFYAGEYDSSSISENHSRDNRCLEKVRCLGMFSHTLIEYAETIKNGQSRDRALKQQESAAVLCGWGFGIADLQGILGMLRLKSLLFGVVSVRM